MNFLGYIEGYYGRLLTWSDRFRILDVLKKNNLKTYFYCPKEDLNHRTEWRNEYPKEWLIHFGSFVSQANLLEIEIIFGISPGIDFKSDEDLEILIKKITSISKEGVNNIAILFDDLYQDSSGEHHAKIVNDCINLCPKINFFTVPQEYASSLALPNIYSSDYLISFKETLHPSVPIFWTGSNVVSQHSFAEEIAEWNNLFQRPLIFWDNFYANDYCGPKVILESYKSMSLEAAKNLNGLMINPTGLIEVDLICLDFFGNFINNIEISTEEYFSKKNFPSKFIEVLNFFKFEISMNDHQNDLSNIESLLWSWHHPVKIEVYSYLHMLRFILKEQNDESINALKKRFRI